jgi:hypothetical protein
LLDAGCIAQIFISGFPLKINHLHDCYGSVTAISAVAANAGAPVDVPTRMNTGSARD